MMILSQAGSLAWIEYILRVYVPFPNLGWSHGSFLQKPERSGWRITRGEFSVTGGDTWTLQRRINVGIKDHGWCIVEGLGTLAGFIVAHGKWQSPVFFAV